MRVGCWAVVFGDVGAWLCLRGPGSWRPRCNVRDPSSPSFGHGRGEGSEAVSPVAMVWPCPLPVDAYVAAGREVKFPRPVCPACAGPLALWSGYWRHVREAGRCRKIFVPRLRCVRCRASHALLPAFVLAWRLDVAETVGAVIGQVAGGACGVRPAAARAGVPYTPARGWVRLGGARGWRARHGGGWVREWAGGARARAGGGRRRCSRGTIGRWLRAWRQGGGLGARRPAARGDTGVVRAHPELFAGAAALRVELP